MDSIKKKMITLSAATDEANTRAESFEEETRRICEIAEGNPDISLPPEFDCIKVRVRI